jgi:hypothetical protein
LTGDAVRDWSEEVELDDGDVVTIERHVEFAKSNSISGDSYSTSVRKSTLAIKGEGAALPIWDDVLLPLVLYRDHEAREWVLVASTTNCLTYVRRGRPMPTYWEFRLQGSSWVETALSPDSLERQTNLFFLYDDPVPKHFTLASKASLSLARIAETYLSIRPDNTFNCG